MRGPWWGKDVDPATAASAADDAATAASTADDAEQNDPGRERAQLPRLTAVASDAIARVIDERRGGFTREWTSRRPDDPGMALVAVYAEPHAVVAAQVDDLPTKARLEHLHAAGVLRRAPRPLEAMLQFELSPAARGSVAIGEGFEVLGRDATGALVPFETARRLLAVPARIAVLGRRTGGSVAGLALPTPDLRARVSLFGSVPAPGTALYLGFAAAVAPSPQLAIGILLAAADTPPPISAGGLFVRPGAEPPRLAWEYFDGRRFAPLAVERDETRGFTQSGVVELQAPPGWLPGAPPGTDPALSLYWVRAQLLEGAWAASPVARFVGLNLVPARSGRTVRKEIVETPLSVDRAVRRTLQLAEHPVLDGTLVVRIDEGGPAPVAWTPVADLSEAGPEDRAFVFDAAIGTLTFGDERTGHGKPLPDGFRHVHASYRVAAGVAAIAAGAINTPAGSAPFLASVTNLEAASGGAEVEPDAAALLRGPREIRARNRAVAIADYEVLALRAPGADIRRAHAVGGLHPRFAGRTVPGVVAVYVVGAARRDGRPPVPTEATLQHVSAQLSAWAPRGAEVVAVAPRFRAVRVEATLELAHDALVTETTRALSDAIDRWFDPVNGGDGGEGWPFGGTIRHDALVRFVLRHAAGAVTAIPRLLLVVDDLRSRPCKDVAIGSHDLLWPAPHELVPLPRRAP
jgi:predicted phage baseplate assembly protein